MGSNIQGIKHKFFMIEMDKKIAEEEIKDNHLQKSE